MRFFPFQQSKFSESKLRHIERALESGIQHGGDRDLSKRQYVLKWKWKKLSNNNIVDVMNLHMLHFCMFNEHFVCFLISFQNIPWYSTELLIDRCKWELTNRIIKTNHSIAKKFPAITILKDWGWELYYSVLIMAIVFISRNKN